MLKKIKTKTTKTSSMLDFVLELNQKYNIKNLKLDDKAENRKLEREKRRLKNQKPLLSICFNDSKYSQSETLVRKNFKEDQENMNLKNIPEMNSKVASNNKNKTITDFFLKKNTENKLKSHIDNIPYYYNFNNSTGQLFKNVKVNSENLDKFFVKSKGKFIEFFDEVNRKNIRFPTFDEKEIKFCKSKKLPQIKLMKLDNDVMTDDEQIKDAANMLRDNLKDVIKAINSEGINYLQKNLSRKMKKK